MIGRAITLPLLALAALLFVVGLVATASAGIAMLPFFIFIALFVTSIVCPRTVGRSPRV